MPDVSEIMTTEVQAIEPQQTLAEAARLMRTLDVGALPVVSGDRLLGMVTDRDLVLRGVAEHLAPDDACVSDVMSSPPMWVTEDQDTTEVLRLMGERQVRRMPVINVDRELVGIVSLGDLALRQPAKVDAAVREISGPDTGPAGAVCPPVPTPVVEVQGAEGRPVEER
jgi:CBS domain-containing protein